MVNLLGNHFILFFESELILIYNAKYFQMKVIHSIIIKN